MSHLGLRKHRHFDVDKLEWAFALDTAQTAQGKINFVGDFAPSDKSNLFIGAAIYYIDDDIKRCLDISS